MQNGFCCAEAVQRLNGYIKGVFFSAHGRILYGWSGCLRSGVSHSRAGCVFKACFIENRAFLSGIATGARAWHGWSALSACWARRLQALLHHASTRLRSVALVQLRLPAYPAHKNLRARALLRTYSIERKTPHLDRVEPP